MGQALAKDPEQRFQTATEFAATLTSQEVVPRIGRRRLAVLPPSNLTNDPEQEYFVQGMHNALISELQRAGVAVIARTSVLRYQNTEKPVRQIAGELGVDILVEPSVFRSANRVELEVGLVDGNTEEYLSDPIYRSGELESVVGMYRELTGAIAAEIQVALTPQAETRLASAQPVNPEVHDAFLRGQFHCWRITPTDLDLAVDCFQRALSLDPTYAPAQAGIAWVWFGRGQFGLVPPREAAARDRGRTPGPGTRQHAGGGPTELACSGCGMSGIGRVARRRFGMLSRSIPTTRMRELSYAAFLAQMERPDEARDQIERALELDPFNPMVRVMNGFRLLSSGGIPRASRHLRQHCG